MAIDESAIAFKGRVTFRQYLKGKLTPWGIKAFVLADSVSGYLYKVAICYGWATELVGPELPHTARVVLTLVDGLEDKGYDVYLDRFYNSPLIATELKRKGITVTGISMSTSCTLYLLLIISSHGPEQSQRTSFCPEPKEALRYGGSLLLWRQHMVIKRILFVKRTHLSWSELFFIMRYGNKLIIINDNY